MFDQKQTEKDKNRQLLTEYTKANRNGQKRTEAARSRYKKKHIEKNKKR